MLRLIPIPSHWGFVGLPNRPLKRAKELSDQLGVFCEVKSAVANRTLAIVPCFNEGDSIAAVVKSIHANTQSCDVLVVNDGSRDCSATQARQAGAMVLDLPCNLGIGGAMQAGYQFALRRGYHYAIQVDGDGQHPSDSIDLLIANLQRGEADLVLGSRYVAYGRLKGRVSSLSRVLGGTLLSYWLKILSGVFVSDPTSGFRAMNRSALTLFAEEYPSDYPEPVSLLMLLRSSLTVCETPVCMKERVHGQSSIRSMQSGIYMIKVMWRMTLERAFR